MIATIRRHRSGFEIVSYLHGAGAWCGHGVFRTFTEACEAAARQRFSLSNAVFDGAMGGWVSDDLALFPFDEAAR